MTLPTLHNLKRNASFYWPIFKYIMTIRLLPCTLLYSFGEHYNYDDWLNKIPHSDTLDNSDHVKKAVVPQ